MIYAGVDLSLTSTGVCVITTPDGDGAKPGFTTERIKTRGDKAASTRQTLDRIDAICDQVSVLTLRASRVAIEGPSFGQMRQAGEHARAGLWWYAVRYFPSLLVVPPATLKTYATGRGNAAKDEVLAAAIRRYPDAEITGNDVADATVLAAIVARVAGHPIEENLPQQNLRALLKVTPS